MSTPVILVVEDDADARVATAEALRVCAFEIVEAEDGAAALEILMRRNVDLIVLDLLMPRLDGYAVLEWLQTRPRFDVVPVCVVSAHSYSSRLRRAAAYLRKPVRAPDLVRHVRHCLEARA